MMQLSPQPYEAEWSIGRSYDPRSASIIHRGIVSCSPLSTLLTCGNHVVTVLANGIYHQANLTVHFVHSRPPMIKHNDLSLPHPPRIASSVVARIALPVRNPYIDMVVQDATILTFGRSFVHCIVDRAQDGLKNERL